MGKIELGAILIGITNLSLVFTPQLSAKEITQAVSLGANSVQCFADGEIELKEILQIEPQLDAHENAIFALFVNYYNEGLFEVSSSELTFKRFALETHDVIDAKCYFFFDSIERPKPVSDFCVTYSDTHPTIKPRFCDHGDDQVFDAHLFQDRIIGRYHSTDVVNEDSNFRTNSYVEYFQRTNSDCEAGRKPGREFSYDNGTDHSKWRAVKYNDLEGKRAAAFLSECAITLVKEK